MGTMNQGIIKYLKSEIGDYDLVLVSDLDTALLPVG